MRNRRKKQSDPIFPLKIDELKRIMERKFENNPDLAFSIYEQANKKVAVFSISYMIEAEMVENYLLRPLLRMEEEWSKETIMNEIPLGESDTKDKLEDILTAIMIGEVFVYVEGEDAVVSYLLSNKEKRDLTQAETESLVLGPKVAFTESIVTNLNIIRYGIRSTDLVMERLEIGERASREVRLIYLKSIADDADVNTMRQRLQDLKVDEIEDTSVLMQYIEDSSPTIFPQFYLTELPDRFAYSVMKGRVGVLVENSPSSLIAPSSFFSFLESTEDLYMRWNAGTFLRFLRFIALIISVLLTPAYVAATTFHYEIIPTQELITIGESRSVVPFPPIYEALLLEFSIELLREAGARLPTKIGQTIGIVGGIVIGTAAVEAGITSNFLVVLVALSALASFTIPNYLMSTSVRILRFPMIILAGTFGMVGMMFGICFLIIHLLKLKSLGRPYLAPIYPFRWEDINKVLYRLPMSKQYKRFVSYQPKDFIRFGKRKSAEKKDIDE
ncbi:spore germination protein [Virgibacillus sp. NKC19-3]|uniref:spore germination protein n=1 Tax=Virgibacillus saliphilus TaxID=2831674 RepID=UPI001C9BB61E|nr:spore germination protein [Virgibacillus sp. NKC19-3]MBY7143001.1 spore germination protein [Virgibacillus sp. NKC19-3]